MEREAKTPTALKSPFSLDGPLVVSEERWRRLREMAARPGVTLPKLPAGLKLPVIRKQAKPGRAAPRGGS